jgi:haloalkane dehalogenase
MHYVDEGEGEPLLFVHGNPVWSFSFRKLVKEFSKNFRCVAIDHLGFGLSDKPANWPYRPCDHAVNLRQFIEAKGLRDLTLVVNDWGGPIGFHYAIDQPDNVKRLIIFNTFMWSVQGDPHYERFSAFMGGPVGKFLNVQFNFFGNVIMKLAFGDKKRLTHALKRQLTLPLVDKRSRDGSWIFPKEIIKSSAWLNSIWQKRELISRKPTLVIWGMKDIAFRRKELETFRSFLENCSIVELPAVGHFVQDEGSELIIDPISRFLSGAT